MRAEMYLESAIKQALGGDIPVRPVRLNEGDGVPAVIFRSIPSVGEFDSFSHALDGSVDLNRYFEIECRSETCPGAIAMADDILAEISPHSLGTFVRYDERDDASQKKRQPGQTAAAAGYYSHIIEIGLPSEGLP